MLTSKLFLDFTTAILGPGITFTRTGATATCVNSSGLIEVMAADTPRFDFNPMSLICKGLLVEGQKTNLITDSDNFNTGWVKSNCTVSPDVETSPDGTGNADLFTSLSGFPVSLRRSITVTTTDTYTLSVFAKATAIPRLLELVLSSNSNMSLNRNRIYVNLATGAISSPINLLESGAIPFPNGYWRIYMTFNPVFTGAGFYGITSSADLSAGDVAYLYGAQLETGSVSSYIPTGATTVTRNQDVAVMTGTNFSDWWQASKGGAQVQAIPSTVFGIRPLVQYDDGTADNIIALRGNAANPELQIVDGGAPQVQLDAGTIVANTPYSLTGWWSTNDCKARQNSGATVSDYTATIPTVTQARLGSDGTNYLNGHLATINYYDSFFGRSIYTRRKNKVFASLL